MESKGRQIVIGANKLTIADCVYKEAPIFTPVIQRTGYSVVEADETFAGKTYAEWISDWYNWFLSENPDDHNNGPVFFLKSYPPPSVLKKLAGDGESTDSNYKSTYINYPNLAVGNDSVEIFDDQAILAPVMGANMDADDPATTEEYMRNWVRNQINNGDNPPKSYQLMINDQPVFDDENELVSYRIETPVFQLMVPEAEYGTSLKDFMEIPYKSGAYNSVADGYFVILKDLTQADYKIHCYAQGSNYGGKQRYFSEYLYHIRVLNRDGRTTSPSLGIIPDRFTNLLRDGLKTKLDDKEIDEPTYNEFIDLIKSTRDRQETVATEQALSRTAISGKITKLLKSTYGAGAGGAGAGGAGAGGAGAGGAGAGGAGAGGAGAGGAGAGAANPQKKKTANKRRKRQRKR